MTPCYFARIDRRCFQPHTIIRTEDATVTLYDAPLSDEQDFKLGREGHGYDFPIVGDSFRCCQCLEYFGRSAKGDGDVPNQRCINCAKSHTAGGQGRDVRAITTAGVTASVCFLILAAVAIGAVLAAAGNSIGHSLGNYFFS